MQSVGSFTDARRSSTSSATTTGVPWSEPARTCGKLAER
jgi:hypothetical protein